MTDRFAAGPSTALPSGQGKALFSRRDSDIIFESSAVFVDLFRHCQTFKTLNDHAKGFIEKTRWRDRPALFEAVLKCHSELHGHIVFGRKCTERMLANIIQAFAEREIFIHESRVKAWCESKDERGGGKQPKTDPRILNKMGIMTCNRPESLGASLGSYLQNLSDFGRTSAVVHVCDDSKALPMRELNQEVARKAARRFGIEVVYAGLSEKRIFADRLVQKGIPISCVEFSLFDSDQSNYSYGANCNSLYLACAGEIFFATDDDTVCRLSKPPHMKPTLRLGAEKSLQELWFFENRESALAASPVEAQDLLGLHEGLVGHSLREVVRQQDHFGDVGFEGQTASFFRHLKADEGAVVLSHNGLLGDSGSNSSKPFLFSSGAQQERLFRSEKTFQSAFQSREILKTVLELTLMPATPCMSTFYAVDNREVVPPFFPFFRDCDSLFGEMIQVCNSQSYYAYLPQALLHSPPEARSYGGVANIPVPALFMMDSIRFLMKSFKAGPDPSAARENLKKYGVYLGEIAQMEMRDIRAILCEQQKKSLATDLEGLRQLLLDHSKAPKFWKRAVEGLIQKHGERLKYPLAIEDPLLVMKFGPDGAAQKMREYLGRYAEVVRWWPEIFDASRELKREGHTLGQSLRGN